MRSPPGSHHVGNGLKADVNRLVPAGRTLRRPALARSKVGKRCAEANLGLGPFERHALASLFLQRLAKGGDGQSQCCGEPGAVEGDPLALQRPVDAGSVLARAYG